MDRGAWKAAVHGVAEGRTWLSYFTFTFHFHALEKEMATHSSVLAWRIPGMGEPDGLLSMGSHRVGHNWSDLAVSNPIPSSSIINRTFLLKFNSHPGVCLVKPVQGFPLSSVNTSLWNTYKTSSHIGTYYPLILGSSHTDFIFFYF